MPMDTNEKLQLEEKVKVLESETLMLHRELAIKSVISEISQLHRKDDQIEVLYRRIFILLSEIIPIDNFYVVIMDKDRIRIPFIIDHQDQFSSDMLDEQTNPDIRKSLVSYALERANTLQLTEAEIVQLEKDKQIRVMP